MDSDLRHPFPRPACVSAGGSARIRAALALLGALPLAGQPPPPAPLARLESEIRRITTSVNAAWGLYAKCLQTGETVALDADTPMDTMSVIKIPLMVEVFRQVREGRFPLSDRHTVQAAEKRPGTGILRSLDDGAVVTVLDLITLMNIVSDNTATDILFAKAGGIEPVNALMQSYGLATIRAVGPASDWFAALRAAPSPAEFHRVGKTAFGWSSARDMGRLLEKIALGEAVSREASRKMLEIMRGQIYRTRIPRYVTGYAIPHKTGDFLPYIANDVGLLESPERTVVLCVFTARHFGSPAMIENAIGRVSEKIGDYFAWRR